MKEIKGCSDLVVFGPSNMKRILAEEIRLEKELSDKLKGVEDADSMTDNQIGAWVTEYFNK